MKRARAALLLFVLSLLVASSPAPAQTFAVEKYKLANGMTVILYPDHTLPVAAVNIWYRVGSKDEPERRSGFAHLFEHLMFMGTERVPGGDFDRLMEAAGGSNNASTGSDGTHYYSSGPASLLPTLLWLDAERLEDLPRTMDQKKVDLQRDVVLNELRQSYENQPYGRADLAIQQLLYPPGHPYHFPGIGTAEDLKAAVATDVKDFFATYYVPNNASLVVAGDFDPAAIKPLVEKLFGTLPRGAEPPRKAWAPVKLGGVKRAAMADKVQLPLVSFAYHTPPAMQPGDAECDLLASVLADGKSSRLYKRLVIDDKLASAVSATNASQALGSFLRIDVQGRPDADLAKIEKAVDEELARLLRDGVGAAELAQRKETMELAKLSSLQRLETRADQLNFYEDVWGEPNSFKRDLDRYRNATPETVLAAAKKSLTQDARVIHRVVPEQPRRAPSARDARPADGPAAAFRPKSPARFKLANGIPVEFWSTPDLPLTRVAAVFRASGAPESPADAGVTSMMAGMLDEGAGERDTLQFGEAVAALGGSLSTSASRRTVQASLTVLSRNVAKGVPLLADAVRRPRFAAPDFDRVKRLTLDELAQSEDEAPVVADRVAARMLFGDGHPYALPVDGTAASVPGITLEKVKAAHAALVRPDDATLLVASSLPEAEIKSALEASFGDWKASGPRPGFPSVPAAYAPAAGPGPRVYLVDRPDAPQTSVRFLGPSPKFDDPSRVPLRLLGTVLGGSFTSRLNQNLREKHGYTYGAGGRFSPGPVLGTYSFGAEITAKDTGAAVKEFLAEFRRVSAGDVTDEEAGKARGLVTNSVVGAFSGLSGIVGTAASYVDTGVPFETLAQDLAAMEKTNAAALNAAAKTAIPLERSVLVLVGDKATILPQLKDSGLPAPVEVDTWGEKKKDR